MPVLSFKVSPADARTIRAKARAQKQSVSEYIRSRTLPPPPAAREPVLKKHPVSGLLYDASPGPVVTDEEIRAALADFP